MKNTKFKAFIEKAKEKVGNLVPELGEALIKLGTGNYIGAIIDVGQGLTKTFSKSTDKESTLEISELLDEFEENRDLYLLEMDEITKRWESDNTQSSWLPKNIRPLTLAFLVVSTMIMCILESSSFGFVVKDSWVDLWQLILLSVIAAYFGSRGLEKIKGKS